MAAQASSGTRNQFASIVTRIFSGERDLPRKGDVFEYCARIADAIDTIDLIIIIIIMMTDASRIIESRQKKNKTKEIKGKFSFFSRKI